MTSPKTNLERWGIDISDRLVNKTMRNAKRRMKRGKPLSKLQRHLLDRAIANKKEELNQTLDPDQPLERPE